MRVTAPDPLVKPISISNACQSATTIRVAVRATTSSTLPYPLQSYIQCTSAADERRPVGLGAYEPSFASHIWLQVLIDWCFILSIASQDTSGTS